MRDRLVRFAVYAGWLKDYFKVTTPESERMARDRAILVEIKGVLYARVPEHRYKMYRRMKKK